MKTHILLVDKEGDEFITPISTLEMSIIHVVEDGIDVDNFIINGYFVYESEYNRVESILVQEDLLIIS